MKLAAFSVGNFEVDYFKTLIKKYNYEMDLYEEELADISSSLDLAKYEMISVIAIKKIPNEVLDRFTNLKVIALRSIGFQYLDLEYCKKRGIVVTNASYDPYNVADFTIMLMLMSIRNAKIAVCRALVNDFSLEGLRGPEMRNMTVGIIGTGKIGSTVIKELSGFGCKILCHDIYQNEQSKKYATYTDLDTIYKECDIISLHMPLLESNYHIINSESIAKMKDGVIIINTARGPLCDTNALIDAVESMKIGALALDTIEGEEGLAHIDIGANREGLAMKKNIMYLKQFANVILTPHTAFFTKEATYSMVECGFITFDAYLNNKEYKNRII